jgi:hypothetical protein
MLRVVAIAIGLLKMLLELQQTRRTGALDVEGPGARVRLFIERGEVVLADEGTVGETLGRMLVREQVLTSEQYSAALEWMAGLRSAGKRAMLGEVFLDLGLLTAEQVHAALAAQVQQKVLRALAWSSATFRFIETDAPLDVPHRFETAIEPLAIAALRLGDRERIDELLAQARPRYAALRGDGGLGGGSTRLATIARVNAFRFSRAEDTFARSLDGSRSVAELLAEKDAVDRGVILAGLLLTDALDLHGGAIAVAPANAVAPAEEPAPAPPNEDRDEDDNAVVAVERVDGVAPVVGVSHPPGEGPLAPLLAEKAYQAGKKLVRAGHMEEGAAELKRAASLYSAVEYDLWAAWAEARADAQGEGAHVEKLRAVAELAIAQDTERELATLVLEHLAKRPRKDAKVEADAKAEALPMAPTPAPARAVAPAMMPEPPASSRGWLVALGVAAAIGVGVLIVRADSEPRENELNGLTESPITTTVAARPVPRPSAAPVAVAVPDADADADADGDADAQTAPVAGREPVDASSDASYAARDGGLPSLDATKGRLLLPSAGDGHRVYVDGKLAGVPPPPLVVGCGRHTVKIGSQGRDQAVVVPCGGTVSLPYP